MVKKFDFLKDCASYLETTPPNVKKVIDRKTSWKESYFIAYSDTITLDEYKLTKSKDIKVKKEDKFIFKDKILHKHCNKCNTYKSVEEFGRNKNLKHGVELYCKECNRKRNKKPRNSKYIFKEYDRK
jgi:hypothetical protein